MLTLLSASIAPVEFLSMHGVSIGRINSDTNLCVFHVQNGDVSFIVNVYSGSSGNSRAAASCKLGGRHVLGDRCFVWNI